MAAATAAPSQLLSSRKRPRGLVTPERTQDDQAEHHDHHDHPGRHPLHALHHTSTCAWLQVHRLNRPRLHEGVCKLYSGWQWLKHSYTCPGGRREPPHRNNQGDNKKVRANEPRSRASSQSAAVATVLRAEVDSDDGPAWRSLPSLGYPPRHRCRSAGGCPRPVAIG